MSVGLEAEAAACLVGPCGGKIPIDCVSEVTVAVLLGSGAACLGVGG